MPRLIFCTFLLLFSYTATAQKFTGTLKKIADSGVFTIGYREDSTPFSFKDESGLPAGYSVDLCRRIATATKEALGLSDLKVEFVSVTLENRFDAIENGKVDIVCGSTTITLSRLERADFTLMTFVTGGSLVSMVDAPIKTTGDLNGKSVAVLKGTTTEAALEKYLQENLIDATVVKVDSRQDGMNQVDTGEVHAFASDQIVLIGQIVDSKVPQDYVLAEDLFSFEPYGFLVRRNDAAFRLIADRSLAQIYRTGQFQALFNKWFGRVGVRPSPVLAAMYKMQSLPE